MGGGRVLGRRFFTGGFLLFIFGVGIFRFTRFVFIFLVFLGLWSRLFFIFFESGLSYIIYELFGV